MLRTSASFKDCSHYTTRQVSENKKLVAMYHLPIYQCSGYFGKMICIVSIIRCIMIHIVLLI